MKIIKLILTTVLLTILMVRALLAPRSDEPSTPEQIESSMISIALILVVATVVLMLILKLKKSNKD